MRKTDNPLRIIAVGDLGVGMMLYLDPILRLPRVVSQGAFATVQTLRGELESIMRPHIVLARIPKGRVDHILDIMDFMRQRKSLFPLIIPVCGDISEDAHKLLLAYGAVKPAEETDICQSELMDCDPVTINEVMQAIWRARIMEAVGGNETTFEEVLSLVTTDPEEKGARKAAIKAAATMPSSEYLIG